MEKMTDLTYDTRSWKQLGFNEKFKISIAGALVLASIALGAVSFILLLEIPGSVIGLDGLWLSTALAVLGIAGHFHNELVHFQTEVKSRLNKIDEEKNLTE